MTVTVRRRTSTLLAMFIIIPLRSVLAEALHIYAARSLTAAFTDMVRAFPGGAGDVAKPVFGPSSVLRLKIEGGDRVDVFASADSPRSEKRALA